MRWSVLVDDARVEDCKAMAMKRVVVRIAGTNLDRLGMVRSCAALALGGSILQQSILFKIRPQCNACKMMTDL